MYEKQEHDTDSEILREAAGHLRRCPVPAVPDGLRGRVLQALDAVGPGRTQSAVAGRGGRSGRGRWKWMLLSLGAVNAVAALLIAAVHAPWLGRGSIEKSPPQTSPVAWQLDTQQLDRGWSLLGSLEDKPVLPTYSVTRGVVEALSSSYQEARRVTQASAQVQNTVTLVALAPSRPMNLHWMQEGLRWAEKVAHRSQPQ